MGFPDGLSGVDLMVAWISSTTLWAAKEKDTSPSAARNPNTLPAAVDPLGSYLTPGWTPLFRDATQAIVE